MKKIFLIALLFNSFFIFSQINNDSTAIAKKIGILIEYSKVNLSGEIYKNDETYYKVIDSLIDWSEKITSEAKKLENKYMYRLSLFLEQCFFCSKYTKATFVENKSTGFYKFVPHAYTIRKDSIESFLGVNDNFAKLYSKRNEIVFVDDWHCKYSNPEIYSLQYINYFENIFKISPEVRNQEFISTLHELEHASVENLNDNNRKYALYSVAGAIVLLLLVIITFLSLRKNKKQNKFITEQKSVLEHQKQEITDSINYSKRIQTAILPDLNEIRQNLCDFFILYQPKDIVSGDFYYFNKVNNDIFMAAADCTGHGVPGAFMSLVGSKELKIANSFTNSPAQILKHLNNGVKDTLRQNHIDGTKDGMDIALVRINGTTVTYSAANRPLWILKKDSNVIEEIKATKTAIAGFTEDNFEFEEHEIILANGDTIYLFSDGYADQFGGDKQKKMTTKRFREFIISIKNQSMSEQRLALESYFSSWKGNTEQVDDLLVIGIKI
jgi:serine phosphatase RsbU (regulator of sigma subunit)